MKKLGHILFIGAILLACAVPAVGVFILGPSSAAGNEILSPAPRLTTPDGSFNLEFLSDAADWFSDHFAFRQELVTAEAVMKSSLFATSAQTDVALGRDGWLYYAETLDDYTGADAFTPRQAWCAARSLALAQDYVEARGGVFTFTIAPNKISLYPQFAPAGLDRAEITAADLLVEQLTIQGVHYTDLFGPFSQEDEVLYHQLDSHWTNKGAALGHDLLMQGLGLSGSAWEKPGEYRLTHRGDLYEMLYPASDKLDRQFEFEKPLAFEYATPIRSVDDLRIQTVSGSANPPLLMFRDSFGNALHALMAESFSEAVFSRVMPYNMPMMEQVGAKYVVVELVERNLPLLAQGSFLMPAPEVDFRSYAEPCGAAVALERTPAGNLPGYVQITGQADISCDPDSPVYVRAGGAVYEAFPTASGGEEVGFSVYLPEDETAESVFFLRDGQWTTSGIG